MRGEETLWYLLNKPTAYLFFHAFGIAPEEDADYYAVWRCHLSRAQEEYLIGLVETLSYSHIVTVEGRKYALPCAGVSERLRLTCGYEWKHTVVVMVPDSTVYAIMGRKQNIGRINGAACRDCKKARRRGQ